MPYDAVEWNTVHTRPIYELRLSLRAYIKTHEYDKEMHGRNGVNSGGEVSV